MVGNSLVGTCLTLPNLGLLWVFFKYPKISKNGNPLFFPVFSEGYSRAKLFIDYFSGPCELFKNAHACALRDCLGVSRPFVSDTSPKCIDREGLKRRRAGTRQGTLHVDKIQVRFKIVNITHALPVPVFHTETWDRFPFA